MLILIAGGTCAGKSTLACKLGDFVNSSLISTDDFVKLPPTTNQSVEEQIKKEYDWSNPYFVDIVSLKEKIQQELCKSSNKIVFVEGMHALQFEELRKLAGVKIFSDTDEALRLILKCKRSPWYKEMVGEKPKDKRKFGGSLPVALKRWEKGVRPGELQYVIPAKHYADIIIDYNSNIDLVKINYALWISLGLGAIVLVGLVIYFLIRQKRSKK